MKANVIAFYLPQFHPVKENDEWFGKGFTEWTSVAKAKPLFKGHYQPRVPADLGFYDLRVPDVRKAQAELAKEAGISAFCYYHYWFGNGKQILEYPLNEVVRLGEPDFPFCLCWANHSWYKKAWDSRSNELKQELLIEQTYPGDNDIIHHFYALLDAFRDKRYYKIHGKLAFVIYSPDSYPELERMISIWRQLAIDNNLPGFHFIAYTRNVEDCRNQVYKGVDSYVLALISNHIYHQNHSRFTSYYTALKEKIGKLTNTPLLVYDYKKIMQYLIDPICKISNVYPVLVPNWDYTPRRGAGGLIYKNTTPDLFYKHASNVIDIVSTKDEQDKVVFLKSWNEWGEGNYMEPDLRYGKGYIEALNRALNG